MIAGSTIVRAYVFGIGLAALICGLAGWSVHV